MTEDDTNIKKYMAIFFTGSLKLKFLKKVIYSNE